MINTLFLTTVAVEPTFVAFLQYSPTHFHGLSCQFFQISLKKDNSKPPTMPFRIVACTFPDNLSRNSCKPLYGVPQGGLTYHWPFINFFYQLRYQEYWRAVSSTILFSLAFYFRYSIVPAQEKCSICSYPLLTRGFYVFPCHHAFHCDCVKNEVRLLRLFL